MIKATKEIKTYDDIVNSGFVEEKTELEKIVDLSRSLRSEYRHKNDTVISSIAYNKLRELGFNNTLGTLYLVDLIEDLYSERLLLRTLGEHEYFDLSFRDNIHYKYIYDRWLTALILAVIIFVCDIGLAMFGFLLFTNKQESSSSSEQTPIIYKKN